MESKLVWKDEYNIGVDILDKEHQRLFKIINKLLVFSDEEKKSQWACQEGIKFFKDHAMNHFDEEEEYMESVNYEGLKTHKHIHQVFREETLPALEKELEQMDYSANSVNHFLGVCAGWLVGHTLTEDRAIVNGGVDRWSGLLPKEEQEAMKKVIIQLIYDMFSLESHVISDIYGGEKFGKGVYYRLVYGKEQVEEKCEIFMVFEDRLLINTVGKIMGVKTDKLDTMLLNATRFMARQFVGRIMEHLSEMDGYELKEENLLTYEQFKKVFEKEKLQVSLLIDTGGGYFAYSTIAPHLLDKEIAAPIGAENAVAEIEKYLMEKKKEPAKPKILLVDDSIPVIFLTGRTDPDTVRKLTAMRPDGYLAKYLKPSEIKNKIDEFFEKIKN
ncbi:MAG: hemerythrin [Dorea sp.]|nr:hemerythrin [Dorea sp.]